MRCLTGLITAAVLAAATGPSLAQDEPIPVSVEPPRIEAANPYLDTARSARADTDIVYASALEGGELRQTAPPEREFDVYSPVISGNFGMIFVLVLLGLLLLLWLRFGSGGALVAGAPRDIKRKTVAPDAWGISADEEELPADALLRQIAEMHDRGKAMAQLLRHCLLRAADVSDTRFARSDTERTALSRLPDALVSRTGLDRLTRATELAHYGGRDVSDTTFQESLTLAREILTMRAAS